MQTASKQFGAKDTASPKNQFQLTRLRLTGIYALILFVILVLSGITTHSIFGSRLDRRFKARPIPPAIITQINIESRDQIQEELITSLVIVNGFFFITAVGLSYFLAGVTLKPIQQSYNRQQQFIGDASHELRTPLAILQTDLENELQEQRAHKETIKSHLEEVSRMSSIVNDLLMLSRLDTNTNHANHVERINLSETIENATNRLKKYAQKNHINLKLSLTNNIHISANKEHILQALTNIIKNSIEYNKKNGNVTITQTQNSTNTTITIEDTGIGIPKEDLPKIFDRFYRVDKSRSRTAGGNGLGLSIVKSIIHSYRGSIAITSTPEKGTTTTITFPKAQA